MVLVRLSEVFFGVMGMLGLRLGYWVIFLRVGHGDGESRDEVCEGRRK